MKEKKQVIYDIVKVKHIYKKTENIYNQMTNHMPFKYTP